MSSPAEASQEARIGWTESASGTRKRTGTSTQPLNGIGEVPVSLSNATPDGPKPTVGASSATVGSGKGAAGMSKLAPGMSNSTTLQKRLA
ncbi:MAG: hypothetical protein ABI442_13505 [Gemmatimonadaceae bacterium]